MIRQTLNIEKNEIISFGKASTLLNTCFIVIDSELNIEYINDLTFQLLNIDKTDSKLPQPFLEFWAKTQLPNLIDLQGKLIFNDSMRLGVSFKQWKQEQALIDGKSYFLLFGQDVSEIEHIKNIISYECNKITGHQFNRQLSTVDYINEIYHYLTNIINKIPCYIYWKNIHLEYIGCNQMAADFINFKSTQDIIGKNDFDIFIDQKLAQSYQTADNHILASGQGVTNEPGQLINYKGEVLHTLVSKMPLSDRSGKIIGLVGITVDVTDLNKAKNLAESATRAKTEFLANMSHDIRTPLTGVVGMSQMLTKSISDLKQKEYARMLCESGEQLLCMLNDILDTVSADSTHENDLHEQLFSLKQMIHDIVELERPTTIIKSIELITTIDDLIPNWILSDRTKLHRILLNLLSNAIKFTKTGHVNIGAKLLGRNDTHALIQFHVKDTGIGIPYALQDKVFDRFFSGTASYEEMNTGHGVGLHIAQSYAHLLGGNIQLTSEPNVGSTFYFDLSLRISEEEISPMLATHESHTHAPPLDPQSIAEPSSINTLQPDAPKLLLVEDNAIALLILKNLVVECGCHFMHSSDGLEAFTLATTHPFDLIITDLGLPGLSGIEFTQKLRRYEREHHKPSIPIIGLTAHADVDIKKSCIEAGMDDTYTKPLTMDALKNIKLAHLKNVMSK